MVEYWDHSCSIWLKNNTDHGINQPWIEKTSTEDLKNSEMLERDEGKSGRQCRAILHSSTVYEISSDTRLSPDLLTAVTTK